MDPEEVIRLYCRPSQEHLQLVNMKLEIQRRTFYLLSLAGHKRSRVEEAEQRSRVIREVNACSEAYDEYLKLPVFLSDMFHYSNLLLHNKCQNN